MRIDKLKGDVAYHAKTRYEAKKLSKVCAYLCRFFGFYRLYTGDYGLFFLYLLSRLFTIPGLIWWIIDGLKVSKYLDKKNSDLDFFIYSSLK